MMNTGRPIQSHQPTPGLRNHAIGTRLRAQDPASQRTTALQRLQLHGAVQLPRQTPVRPTRVTRRRSDTPRNPLLSKAKPTQRRPVRPQRYREPPLHPSPYNNTHLVNINRLKSHGEIQNYFGNLAAQERAGLFDYLNTSPLKQLWFNMTDAGRQKAYWRFRNSYPRSPFAPETAGRAMRRFVGDDSPLTVLVSIVTLAGFVRDSVREWKERRKKAREERIKELEGKRRNRDRDEEIEGLKRGLQGGGWYESSDTDDGVTPWLEDPTQDGIEYRNENNDRYGGSGYVSPYGDYGSQWRHQSPYISTYNPR